MDIRKVKKLIELLEESGLSEIEITEGEDKVRISKQTTVAKSSNDSATIYANDINEGDWVSVNGTKGKVYLDDTEIGEDSTCFSTWYKVGVQRLG